MGRFASADTLVQESSVPQTLNRYSYGYNNPVKYTDPSGHAICESTDGNCDPYEEEATGPSPQEELYDDTLAFLEELEAEGLIEPGWSIRQQYRSREEAHLYGTAFAIWSGLVPISDVLATPVDNDGNRWVPVETQDNKFCMIIPGLCSNSIRDNAFYMAEDLAYENGLGIMELPTAFEGYELGDPNRLPNTSDLPVSAHVLGLAVDIDVTWAEGVSPWAEEVDIIAARHGLYRPFHADEGRRDVAYQKWYIGPEWWHFEPMP